MYHAETGLSMARHRRTLVGLHQALATDEFEIWYQPIVDLTHERVMAYEALLRWRHPYRGLLGPSDFILDAERSGLISEIGERVLRSSLGHAARRGWDDAGVGLSVNVSAGQIVDPGFVGSVAAALADTAFDPGRLWLEITESALLTDARAARKACEELRALGVHLAIDDFGTGYGSLTYLVEFPVESIKIDRSFVAGLAPDPAATSAGTDHARTGTGPEAPGGPGDANDGATPMATSEREQAIVSALVGLTRRLGLRCVAEGVENDAQVERLRMLGVDLIQGHHVGRPQRNPDPIHPAIRFPGRSSEVPLQADSEGVS
jgi:EAL domain-containing protein (putative c-di-GMP-specific phosphodiesterase class I)